MLYLPLAETFINAKALFLIGLFLGLLGKHFGNGANLLMVPSLSVIGLPTSYAIGANITQEFGRSSPVIFKSGLLKGVRPRLALTVAFFGLLGVIAGQQLLMFLTRFDLGGTAVRSLYLLLLSGTGLTYLFQLHVNKKGNNPSFNLLLSSLNIQKHILTENADPTQLISLRKVAFIGVAVGFLTGFLGLTQVVGIILLVGLLGLPLSAALGTEKLFTLAINTFALFIFALHGRVEFLAALLFLIGIMIGNRTAELVPLQTGQGIYSRAFGLLLLLTGASLVFKQFHMADFAALILLISTATLSFSILIRIPFQKPALKQNTSRLSPTPRLHEK